ncbi:TetR/AcrR family transcriptional regulator [Streptomyces tubercidicus]|uniref:TetR/AcrR family transcriptional regulator n=1 Tax=Streptomyces TaxID=1883 RepID=UPI0025B5C34E|nr:MULTISPECIES: TetR/AcrR family transcriptional regulator [Streptomyces]WJY43246.1 helix-turn-helix domain-containing protein [Streptomyces sp. P9-2B-2]WSW49967.1 TetR/AcrR family transcriptional regulator [Streptomyces platensis]WSX24154.1 TetR/AcrR family transcriptional regulator [Streptomyces tubercidicus]
MAEVRRERADAARNRHAILKATESLLSEHPPEQVSMERIAAAAGVGKGTVFHRFGSRAGLMRELMLERAHALRESVTDGPPPLGPGAPPRQRLLAFLDAVVDVVGRNKGLLAALGQAATAPRDAQEDSREQHSVYGFWHGHISELITEERSDLDAELLAHILLGALQNGPIVRLLGQGEAQRLAVSLRLLVTGMLEA